MTQVHVSDAKDMAESVAAQAAEYAGALTDGARARAGGVANRVRRGLEPHDQPAKKSHAARCLTWGLVLAAAVGLAFIAVRRSRREPNAQSPPVTNLGPEAGTRSDIPGPAYDPPANDPPANDPPANDPPANDPSANDPVASTS